ncbi:nucleotide excision repair endonuclease [Fodinibius sp.]|uniref:nucleotide excision repair endonuclease n=1 Tax=Fodinibius sp. TaxID=1872440 RepID=UPI002ACDB4B9|nr:nucleotide excision repair endonuclease [Fodinibius sp.]MDZ7660020.1 nucleotide excision repair endonuclease [Fodinibius sp.]
MSEQQRLFEHYNPIEKRLEKSFFEELPTEPGVYKMYGRSGDLLYVGKAKDLRNRLFTYRRAKMGTDSRKTIRLIRMTHKINIHICDSEKEALLLENELIRKHQPEFNYAKKKPETYYFIGINRDDKSIGFSLQMNQPQTEFVFGAFKGHRLVRKSMGGILRILYILEHDVSSVFHLPSILTRKLTPMEYDLPIDREGEIMNNTWDNLLQFLRGQSTFFIDRVIELCKDRGLLESFAGSMILDDLESLKWFYERCSSRNYQIYKQLELDSPLISQEKLDDYLIEWVFERDEND